MLDVREDREMSLTKQRAEYIRCIARTHADFKGKAWCGRAIDAFSFVGIDHAAENGRQEGRLVACHECVTAIETALSNGHAAEKRHATTNRKMLREINRLANRCTTTTEVAYDEALIALLKKVGEIPEHLARLAAEPDEKRCDGCGEYESRCVCDGYEGVGAVEPVEPNECCPECGSDTGGHQLTCPQVRGVEPTTDLRANLVAAFAAADLEKYDECRWAAFMGIFDRAQLNRTSGYE